MSEIFKKTCKKLERKITCLKYQINVVPSEDIQVTELYELENGDIYCTFKCKDVITAVNTSEIKVPEGMRYKEWDDGWQEIYFQYPRPFETPVDKLVYGDEISVVFPRADNGYWDYTDKCTHKCTTIYYGRKNKKDKLIVWEEGQALEPAPEEIQ